MGFFTRNLVTVPKNLAAITTIDAAAECRPEDAGMTRASVDAIWKAVEDYYRTGLQPMISLTLRRHGRIVLKRSIGYTHGGGPGDEGVEPVLATPETPVCLFSASKAVTAMLLHKLHELGKLKLDDPVTKYLPEYGAGGKGDTTIRHLLTHRAGIPQIAISDVDPRTVFDWDAVIEKLCAAKPVYRRDEYQAYHAITGGFILGEVARRVGGASLHKLMKKWIAKPLGARHMTYGMPKGVRELAATNYYTGSKQRFPMTVLARRILGVEFDRVVEISNDPQFLSSVIPAGNLYATADEIGRFYQMMLNQGEYEGQRLFKAETIAEAVRPYGHITFDRTLFLPIRFSAGMMLGEWPAGVFGPDCANAYGHLGFLTILAWADPDRDISVGFVNSGKTIAAPAIWSCAKLVYAINSGCQRI